MPGIKRRDPHPEAAFPSQHVGERAGEWRRVRNLSQEEVAKRMKTLGHTTWRRQTVAQVEAAARSLTVDELVSLAMAVECTVRDLFRTSPFGMAEWSDPNTPITDLGLPDPVSLSDFQDVLGFNPTLREEGVMFQLDENGEWPNSLINELVDAYVFAGRQGVRDYLNSKVKA